MTPAQCRAGRALVGMSQAKLAQAAGVIFVEENGAGPGVRLRK